MSETAEGVAKPFGHLPLVKATAAFFYMLGRQRHGAWPGSPASRLHGVLSNQETRRNRFRLREGVVAVTTPRPLDIFQEMNVKK